MNISDSKTKRSILGIHLYQGMLSEMATIARIELVGDPPARYIHISQIWKFYNSKQTLLLLTLRCSVIRD